MNETGDRRDCEQREQAAAFVLGALEPHEGERYEAHLHDCATCRDDVARLKPAADALATGPPRVPAPAELRDRVMAQVRAEAQLLNAAGPEADRPPARRWWPARRLALLGATGAVACGVAAGAVVVDLGSHPASRQTIEAQVTAAGAHAELQRTGSHAELVVAGMPQPPSGKIYQVWLARAGQTPQPTDALFSVNEAGRGSIDVPGNLQSVKRVMVTAEPLGGSRHPTSPAVIVVTL